jgi:succinate dehydrogenase / fumarate reductase, cytochrome b subunit
MSSVAVDSHLNRAFRFYQATIGKKAVMAVTGVILFGFIIGHLIGNLQVFAGRETLDAYGAFLHHSTHGLIWVFRAVLLASVLAHIVASIQLTKVKMDARPIGYVKTDYSHSSYASRTMMWSGPIVAAFIIFHLMDLTWGNVNPAFQEGHVYDNLIASFSRWPVSIAYIVTLTLLCLHLYHGIYSMFQSLGISHPKYTPAIQRFAKVAAFLIWAGYVSIPVAVLAKVVQ